MNINYKKSCYLIINPTDIVDLKCSLKLKNSYLEYKNAQKYLGVYITDSGVIKDDIDTFVKYKNGDVSIMLANFMRKNEHSPIVAKLKVVAACVNSSLTYGCEAWSSSSLTSIEVLQRKALKTALCIKETHLMK